MHVSPEGRPRPSMPPNTPRVVGPGARRFRRVRRWYRRTPPGQLLATLIAAVVAAVLIIGAILLLVLG